MWSIDLYFLTDFYDTRCVIYSVFYRTKYTRNHMFQRLVVLRALGLIAIIQSFVLAMVKILIRVAI